MVIDDERLVAKNSRSTGHSYKTTFVTPGVLVTSSRWAPDAHEKH